MCLTSVLGSSETLHCLECVQSLRQWDWPKWRIADSRSQYYFLFSAQILLIVMRSVLLWSRGEVRTLTQHPGLSLAKIQKVSTKNVWYWSKQSLVTLSRVYWFTTSSIHPWAVKTVSVDTRHKIETFSAIHHQGIPGFIWQNEWKESEQNQNA